MRTLGRISAVVATGLAAVLLAAGCGKKDEVTSKSLSIYTFANYIPPSLVKKFEERYGLKVTLTTYASNEEMIEGLKKSPSAYDVIVPSDYAVEILRRARKLEKLDLAKIDNFKENIEEGFQRPYYDPGTISNRNPYRNLSNDQGKFSIPYQYGTTGIAYDSAKVKAPMNSWGDFFEPTFEGKVVMLNDDREVLGAALVSLGYQNNDTNKQHIEQAAAVVEKLKPRIIEVNSDLPEKKLINGEAVAGLIFNGQAAMAAAKAPGIRYVLPDPGGGIWIDNMAIPKDAPHKDAATAFLNFVLEPEEGAEITRKYKFASPNKKAVEILREEDPELVDNKIIFPDDKTLDRLLIIKDVGSSAQATYNSVWARTIKGLEVVE